MAKKIKSRARPVRLVGRGSTKKDLAKVSEDLEKTGEALGDLFKDIFKGVGRVLEVAKEMEERGEKERTFRKEIKGVTKSGKEFRGEAGWKVKTGILEPPFNKEKRE